MKYYDYDKAKKLISEYKKNRGLIRACLGMAEQAKTYGLMVNM